MGGVSPNDNFPFIVLGSKCDKDDRQVEKNEVSEYCEAQGMSSFETSAKENIGIDDAFENIIKLAAEYHNEDIEPAMPLNTAPLQK